MTIDELDIRYRVELLEAISEDVIFENTVKPIMMIIYETPDGMKESMAYHLIQCLNECKSGKSIYEYDPSGRPAEAYMALTKEVLCAWCNWVRKN